MPVKAINSPWPFFTTTPTRSQSGPVPIIRSAPFSSASFIARAKASCLQGWGRNRRKSIRHFLLRHHHDLLNPSSLRTLRTGLLPEPCRAYRLPEVSSFFSVRLLLMHRSLPFNIPADYFIAYVMQQPCSSACCLSSFEYLQSSPPGLLPE